MLPEAWAGILLTGSTLLYAAHRHRAAAAVVVLALFIRELILPYAAFAALLGVWHRRTGEVAVWTIGGLLWTAFYSLHAMNASAAMMPGDLMHPSWIQFGGLRFVFATIGFGGWLWLLPRWTAVAAGVILAASHWAMIRATHLKAAILIYLTFYAVVGQPFNQSWGILTSGIWSLGFGLGFLGLITLWRAATGSGVRLPPRRGSGAPCP